MITLLLVHRGWSGGSGVELGDVEPHAGRSARRPRAADNVVDAHGHTPADVDQDCEGFIRASRSAPINRPLSGV